MTTESIMTSRVVTLRPDDKVLDALRIMHREHIRNLPVVDAEGSFIGLFGVRRLGRLLLPQAARDLDRYSISDLSFLPDEVDQLASRWREVAARPVSDFLEKDTPRVQRSNQKRAIFILDLSGKPLPAREWHA